MRVAVALLGVAIFLPTSTFACQVVRGNGWEGCVEQPERETVWYSRWGAVATDKENGAFGASDSIADKRRAEKKALKQCRKNNGTSCEVRLLYADGCAAVVHGKEWSYFQSHKYRDTAIETALNRCRQKDSECEITYVACSQAVGR